MSQRTLPRAMWAGQLIVMGSVSAAHEAQPGGSMAVVGAVAGGCDVGGGVGGGVVGDAGGSVLVVGGGVGRGVGGLVVGGGVGDGVGGGVAVPPASQIAQCW